MWATGVGVGVGAVQAGQVGELDDSAEAGGREAGSAGAQAGWALSPAPRGVHWASLRPDRLSSCSSPQTQTQRPRRPRRSK